MGCDTNADGTLTRGRSSSRLAGRAFEYAARMMSFYGEIHKDAGAWTSDDSRDHNGVHGRPEDPQDGTSYLVLSEQAYRLAEEQTNAGLTEFTRLSGWYKPRVFGAYKRRVYVRQMA